MFPRFVGAARAPISMARINPPLFPVNVAYVSWYRRPKIGGAGCPSAAVINPWPVHPVGAAISSRPFCLASGPSCVTDAAAISRTMARHTNTVVRP